MCGIECMLKKRGSDAVVAMEEATAFNGVAALRELENAPQKSLREKSATVRSFAVRSVCTL